MQDDESVEEKKASDDSRRPSWRARSSAPYPKYYNERALKRLLNLKPSTAILGSSHIIVHVILGLTDVLTDP